MTHVQGRATEATNEQHAERRPESLRHSGGRTMRFRILGALEAERAGQAIALGSRQQRAVLALLLVHANELVPSDVLVDELWGDEPPEAARNTIYTYISHLRKLIGADRIQSHAPGYRLVVEPAELDAERFERLLRDASTARTIDPGVAAAVLDEALELWRGEALSDVAERGSLLAEATRLDELRLVAGEERTDALLAIGQHARVAGEIEALLDRHPLRERLWRQLMLALYREGRQADALNAFQRVREVLADELGIDASPELRRLHEQILRQDPQLEIRGEPLRGYRLLEKIGEGRTGATFRSIQPHVQRDVAVKIFHEHLASDPSFVRRFEHEARVTAALEHPHIVPVYDHWHEPGRAYVVSRYLKGGSLDALEARGDRLDPDRALVVVEQVASALGFAHRQGIAHGAVRPSNVLFDGERNAYLGDFRIGIGEPPDPADDVVQLASLARGLLGERMPPRLADLIERTGVGTDPPDADAFVEATRPSVEPDPASALVPDNLRNPYKGLRSFTEADAQDFFGRTELIAQLIARLREHDPGSRFVAVVGPSGCGKSSLVKAGLVPAIHRGELGDPRGPFVVDMFPGAHPLEQLEAALLRVATRPARLRDVLEQGSRGLLEATDRLLPGSAELILIVDQFEEVFTLAGDEHERTSFLEALRVAAADPDSRIRVVITLRADFYDRPLVYPRFAELLATTTETVTPLTPDELEQAVRRPAEGVGVVTEPGLVAEMLADVAGQPGALPLLQYALTELFERREDGRLTLSTYRALGGVAGALGARADRIFDGFPPDGRRAARQVFLRLVHLGEGRQDTRRRVTRSELDTLEVDASAVEPVLDTFGRHRLLTFDREPSTREPTVEIAHEALLTAWPRFRSWIDEAREDLRHDRRLAQAAGEWRASDRDPSFLLRGARLEQLDSWASGTDLAIGRPERAYLKASVDHRTREADEERARFDREALSERRSRSRLRALVVVLSVAALVAAGLTAIATGQSQRAEREAARAERAATIATARELAAAAVTNADVDPERSIMLAIEAVELTRTLDGSVLPEAEDALHRALAESRVVLTVPGIGGPVAWGPDGTFAGAAHADPGTVEIRDDRTGEAVRSFPAHDGDITGVAFAPDGMTLATSGTDGALRVWDSSTGELLSEVVGRGPAVGLSVSRSGSFAASWPDQHVVRVVDPTRNGVHTLRVPGVPSVTALSSDAAQVAVTARAEDSSWCLVFDVRSGERMFRWGAADTALSWSPYGGSIATTTSAPSVDVFDVHRGEHLPRVGGGHDGVATTFAWSPLARRLVSGGVDGQMKVWDVFRDGFEEVLSVSSAETLAGIGGIAVAPDGDRVMVGAEDGGVVKIFDISFGGDAEWANVPAPWNLGDMEFLADGRLLTSNPESTATIWDALEGRPLTAVGSPSDTYLGHDDALAVGPDGRSIASVAVRGSVEVWDLDGNVQLFAHHGQPKVTDVDWSPDGELLVMSTRDGRAVIVDRTGAEIQELHDEAYEIRIARFSPDGAVIATSGSGPSGEAVRLWDWKQGRVAGEFPASAYRFAFNPSGTRIATVPASLGQPEVWDVSTGERLVTLAGSSGQVQDAAFGPDGSRVATASFDATGVRMFDSETGALLFTLPGLEMGAWRLDFGPDGSTLASLTAGETKVWALDIDDLLEIARQELTRSLTDEECRQYLHVETCPTPTTP